MLYYRNRRHKKGLNLGSLLRAGCFWAVMIAYIGALIAVIYFYN